MVVKFIAEASSNHSQDLSRALAFVDAAADCGCDAVKFQLFRVAELFAPEILARSAKHRARVRWELPVAHLAPLAERARERRIEFSCTPFYLAAVDELEPFVAFYKIASYELLWHGLLEACAATGKPVIVSTGMATMPEIKAAIATRIREGERADGHGFKEPVAAELSDREWRADPSDGLRPLRHVRATWEPA